MDTAIAGVVTVADAAFRKRNRLRRKPTRSSMACAAAPPPVGFVSRHITPGIQRMLDRLGDVPIGVHSAAWDLLWWNPLWAALTGGPFELRGLDRNVAWRHFMQAPGVIDFAQQHAEEFSTDLVADLREAAGRYPEDPDPTMLINRLKTESPDFMLRWGDAHVARHRSSTKTATSTRSGRSRSTATYSPRQAPTYASSCTRLRRIDGRLQTGTAESDRHAGPNRSLTDRHAECVGGRTLSLRCAQGGQ